MRTWALVDSPGMDKRAKQVPEPWARPLGRWCVALRAAGRSQQTIQLRRSHVAQLARALGGDPARVEVDELVGWLATRTWERETRRSWRATLRSWWAYLGRPDLVEALPGVRPAEPMPRPAPDDALTLALIGADARLSVILRLAAEAGLRRGEIAQVHARDLVPDLGGWSLRVHGKGDRLRLVPLSPGLAAAVRIQSAGGWLLPGNDRGHVSAKWVGTLAARALPGDWSLHTLRHRFATRAYSATGDLMSVSRLLGHASVATTQRYVATDAVRLRQVAESAA